MIKHSYRQTDELMRCGLFHWKWERIVVGRVSPTFNGTNVDK